VAGELRVTAASFGGDVRQGFGTLVLANARGTMSGGFDFEAQLVPDSQTTVFSGQSYAAGVHALRMRVTGELTIPGTTALPLLRRARAATP
jgi:hypothetical protein